jgi:drug/metabolite transporter (DMT)-like permease
MSLSMAGFALNDAIMKRLFEDLPLFPVIAVRGAIMVVVLGVACWMTGAYRWRPPRGDRHLIGWRTAAEMITTVLFLMALANMPIATATAILQSAPLAVTLAAALFLAEPIGWRRIGAMVVGFAGVLLIVRPGTGDFGLVALLPLAAVVGIVVRDLTTRQFSASVPSLLVAFVTSVAMVLLGLTGAALTAPWPPFSVGQLALTGAGSGFLVIGYVFAVRAMRVGEIAFVSPFRYTIMLWALVLGVVFFNEIPDELTIVGAALVIGAGVFTFWREQRVRKLAAQ